MTSTDLPRLAAERARLLEQRDIIAEELEQNKAAILAVTDGPDAYAAGPLTVDVKVSARINAAAIQQAYPPDSFPEIYTQTVDVKAVRQYIAPKDLEDFLTYSAPSVTLR